MTIALVFLGFWFHSRVRALFGVADTAKNEADDTGEPARPIPKKTTCPSRPSA